MLILNFRPAPPISPTQRAQIRASIERQMDARFVDPPFPIRIVEVPQKRSIEATLDVCGLTPVEWRTQAIAVRITAEHPFAGALLAACNERRGYETVIREVKR